MGLKHLTLNDLHLYDREMRSTKKMVENSNVILEELYKFLEENEDITLLNINGDIQHKTPTNKFNRREVAKWRESFRKIGKLLQKRFKENIKGYKLVGVDKETEKLFKKGLIYPIFTTKGNHDIDNELGHTFYDELLEEGLIINARGLLVKVDGEKTYFSYRNYGETNRKIPKMKDTQVIALEHNDVLHEESVLWRLPDAEDKFLKAEDVAKGTDVVILGHIHEKVDPLYVGEEGNSPVIWQAGAIGRTSFVDRDKRDVGYGAAMFFGNVEDFITVEFDLISYKEYFSYKKMVRNKKYENEYKDFSLEMEDREVVSTNYKEDINSFEDVDKEIREYAIKVMEEIKDNG